MSVAAAKVTTKQLAVIHLLAGRAGLEGDTYRDFLHKEAGVNSSKELTAAAADQVLDRLRALAGDRGRPRGAIAGLDSGIARKLQALWIAGYNLGIVRDRTDRAMLSFMERQTGVAHTRFLRDPGSAALAIEGLKSWLAREGKVEWTSEDRDAIANKRAVLDAQWMRLVKIGAVRPYIVSKPLADLDDYAFRVTGKNGWCFFEGRDVDLVQQALGRKLRGALAERRRRQKAAGEDEAS